MYRLSYVFLTDWRDPLFSWFSDEFYIDFEYGQKYRVRIFVDVFRVLCFSPDSFCTLSVSFCMLGGSWGVGQWCFFLEVYMCRSVGRLWFGVENVYVVHGCVRWMRGLVGSFCFAPTVACVSRTSFVFCW